MAQVISFTVQLLIDDSPGPVYVKARVRSTVQGYYVVSIPNSAVTCTPVNDNLNIKATYSVEAPVLGKIQNSNDNGEEILKLIEYEKEIEADFEEGPISVELYRKIHTFNLQGDLPHADERQRVHLSKKIGVRPLLSFAQRYNRSTKNQPHTA